MIWATNDHEEVEWFAYSNGDVRSVPDLSEDNSTFPTEWFEIGDQFVFAGESDAYGRELFVYDGERVEIAADLWAGTRGFVAGCSNAERSGHSMGCRCRPGITAEE